MTTAGAIIPLHPGEIGRERVALLDKTMVLTVESGLSVRVRSYDRDGHLLNDIATTPLGALNLALLFRAAAERADPSLIVRQLEVAK